MSDGKRSYWDQLFGQHRSGIAAFIRRRVRQPADASDLTQEVYLRFLRAGRAELIRNPDAYLYTVAVNLLRTVGAGPALGSHGGCRGAP